MWVSFNPGRDRHSRLRFRLAHLPESLVWLGDGNRRWVWQRKKDSGAGHRAHLGKPYGPKLRSLDFLQ